MSAAEVVYATPISRIYHALTGSEPRRTGERWRGVATWRGGSHLNVAGDDASATWFDHASGEGGGVLDLVARVRGGSRREALRWLADFAGIPLEDHPLSAVERAQWAQKAAQRREDELNAQRWAAAATLLAEDGLEEMPPTDLGRMALTRLLAAVRAAPVAEYVAWREHVPEVTAALVEAGRSLTGARERALQEFIRGLGAEQNAGL